MGRKDKGPHLGHIAGIASLALGGVALFIFLGPTYLPQVYKPVDDALGGALTNFSSSLRGATTKASYAYEQQEPYLMQY